MPYMAIYRADGVDADKYARFRAAVPLDEAPAGALLHSYCGVPEGSLCVVDLWENRAALEDFVENVVVPTAIKVGLTPVRPEIFELGTLAVVGDLGPYKVIQRQRAGEPA